MPDILQLPIADFLAATAAKEPTPGGGSVAALCGALAASLGAMTQEYTLGKKAHLAHDAETRAALAGFQAAAIMLQELLLEDIAAYQALSAMLKLPADQRQLSADFLPAVVAAIRVPQTVAGFGLNILERCAAILPKTNKYLISDLGIAAVYAHATVHAGELMVRVNLPFLPNQDEAAAVRRTMAELSSKSDDIYMNFRQNLLTQI